MTELYTPTLLMPPEIREGLDKKIYEVVGGVIRQTHNKEVVAWLRPATDGGGELARQIPNVGGLAAGAALSAANLAVSSATLVAVVTGFVIISRQIQALDRRLSKVIGHLEEMNADLRWLKQAEWDHFRARTFAALQGMADAEREKRLDDLRPHLTTLREAHNFLLQQLQQVVSQPSLVRQAAAFVGNSEIFVSLTNAKGLALALLRNPRAELEYDRDRDAYAAIRAEFVQCFKTSEANLENWIDVSLDEHRLIRDSLPSLPPISCLDYTFIDSVTKLNSAARASLRQLLDPGPNQPAALILVPNIT